MGDERGESGIRPYTSKISILAAEHSPRTLLAKPLIAPEVASRYLHIHLGQNPEGRKRRHSGALHPPLPSGFFSVQIPISVSSLSVGPDDRIRHKCGDHDPRYSPPRASYPLRPTSLGMMGRLARGLKPGRRPATARTAWRAVQNVPSSVCETWSRNLRSCPVQQSETFEASPTPDLVQQKNGKSKG